MKNLERTGGQIVYPSLHTNKCCCVQTSAGMEQAECLLRTRQLRRYALVHVLLANGFDENAD